MRAIYGSPCGFLTVCELWSNRTKFWENTIFPKLYDQYWYHLFSENKFCDVGNDNTEGKGNSKVSGTKEGKEKCPYWEADDGNESKQGKE